MIGRGIIPNTAKGSVRVYQKYVWDAHDIRGVQPYFWFNTA
jgi:hypothetical protein